MEPVSKLSWEITDPVALGEEIAKGKFATVCTGRSGGGKVALKVFPLEHRDYFENEKYIFQCLGESTQENILKWKGWQEFTVGSSTSLILILDRISPGNLRDFLSDDDTSIDLPKTLKILKGLAAGLSFLHGENNDGVIIAHRDLTSKNILIDKNLVPYIADFGLSLRTKGSRYYFGGKERQAEFCSLSDAGTLRYMAPELLEGAVNLKDLENALKQADIYALALLIWEITNRSPIALNSCHVLPYSPELGKDISIESLTRLVVTRRGRPSFSNWCDLPVSRSLRDTLNESWDAEPDARLTALCVVERLADLAMVQLQNNKNISCTTPLECPPETSPWAGRNVCMERNLMEENSDKSTQYLLTTSEKHRVNFYNGGHSSSVGTVESVVTTTTELSNNGSTLQQPPPIQYLQNIRR
jgi:bone morphogenetic protein receptor type-2